VRADLLGVPLLVEQLELVRALRRGGGRVFVFFSSLVASRVVRLRRPRFRPSCCDLLPVRARSPGVGVLRARLVADVAGVARLVAVLGVLRQPPRVLEVEGEEGEVAEDCRGQLVRIRAFPLRGGDGDLEGELLGRVPVAVAPWGVALGLVAYFLG
jgi:hypothetical protein